METNILKAIHNYLLFYLISILLWFPMETNILKAIHNPVTKLSMPKLAVISNGN